MSNYPSARNVVAFANSVLKEHCEEVNRLNVFPVPDGDTGTNMSLTIEAVAQDVLKLPLDATLADVCKAATHGSLMGARGNSGVILSQIIRGLCEGLTDSAGQDEVQRLACGLEAATKIAYQAVRKPVEGTILTVCKDMGIAARIAADDGLDIEHALDFITEAGHKSVSRTPELLPVLKEAGVVDAGGYGLAIIFDAIAAAILEREIPDAPLTIIPDELSVVPIDDWDDDEYLYCTEFLLFGQDIDRESVHDYVAARGGSELVVGDHGQFKLHVHTDNPAEILAYALTCGEIAEVHIHNMRMQQAARPDMMLDDIPMERKPLGVVAVASGEGIVEILKSLGVAYVVSGGQTMNPSTADLVQAAEKLPVDHVIFLPNNKNIIMAAQAAVEVLGGRGSVVPTRSIPQAFSAMLCFDDEGEAAEICEEMTEAITDVITAEFTTAIKDAKGNVGEIKAGQVIGILNGKDIEAVGDEIQEVVLDLLARISNEDHETLTILAGIDFDEKSCEELVEKIEPSYPHIEVEVLRGQQPLYPVILSLE